MIVSNSLCGTPVFFLQIISTSCDQIAFKRQCECPNSSVIKVSEIELNQNGGTI